MSILRASLGCALFLSLGLAPVAQAGPPPAAVRCAGENEQCSFSGTKIVFYGANDSWVRKSLTNGTVCSNGVFGDPLKGVVKSCFVVDNPRNGPMAGNAPVISGTVSAVVCSGNTYQCVATIPASNGTWYATWKVGVSAEAIPGDKGFVDVMSTTCENSGKTCSSTLRFGDNGYVAGTPGVTFSRTAPSDSSYVRVLRTQCSGQLDSNNCMAQLDFAGGAYVAKWLAPVTHP